MPDTKGAPEMPDAKVSKTKNTTPPGNNEAKAELDDAVSEVNKELEAMAPGLDAKEVVALPDEEPEIDLNDTGDDLLSDELADEIEKAEDEPISESEADFDDTANTEVSETDSELDQAVEDISANEEEPGPITVEPESHNADTVVVPPKNPNKLKAWIKEVWSDPKKRWAVIGGSAALLILISLIPNSRYFVLNTVGVRSSMHLTVIDGDTLQPLKNVTVRAGGAEAKTDSDGIANLSGVRLGRTILQVEKRAFSPIDKAVTIGWGSNPMGEFRATAVGTRYTFFIKDFLSGKPIDGAEAASGDGNASSDEEGRIVLTLDTAELDDAAQLTIDVSADSYRNEALNITVNNKEEQSVSMVPARKHVYVSKRSGKYDVYTAHVDGKNEERIVGGTGYERDDIALVPHPSDQTAAFVATRENTRNPSGYLLSTLYVIDTNSGELTKIDQSEQIQVVGWSKSGRLVYVKIAAGASGTDPKRHRLMSFNSKDFSDTKELASSNSFNDVVMAADKIYYAPSNAFQESPNPAAYVIHADGDDKQTILSKEVYSIIRVTYDELRLNVGESWYAYELDSADEAKPSSAPSSQNGRTFMDNNSNRQSLWVDNRDGKGVMLSYSTEDKKDKTLTSRSGLQLPVYWLNDKYAVFRVRDSREIADYVLNTEGGEPHKITDVTDTAGLGRWFYY